LSAATSWRVPVNTRSRRSSHSIQNNEPYMDLSLEEDDDEPVGRTIISS
jgi:hypothetical protein